MKEKNRLARNIVAMLWWRFKRFERRYMDGPSGLAEPYASMAQMEWLTARNAFTAAYNALNDKWD